MADLFQNLAELTLGTVTTLQPQAAPQMDFGEINRPGLFDSTGESFDNMPALPEAVLSKSMRDFEETAPQSLEPAPSRKIMQLEPAAERAPLVRQDQTSPEPIIRFDLQAERPVEKIAAPVFPEKPSAEVFGERTKISPALEPKNLVSPTAKSESGQVGVEGQDDLPGRRRKNLARIDSSSSSKTPAEATARKEHIPVVAQKQSTPAQQHFSMHNTQNIITQANPKINHHESRYSFTTNRNFFMNKTENTHRIHNPNPPPTVRVTIGRVEVKAVMPPSAPTTPAHPQNRPQTKPSLSLEDYLKQREGSKR